MSHRYRVLIPEDLSSAVRRAAQRRGCSRDEWVLVAIEQMLDQQANDEDPLATLLSLNAPTANIGDMLDEISVGRR